MDMYALRKQCRTVAWSVGSGGRLPESLLVTSYSPYQSFHGNET